METILIILMIILGLALYLIIGDIIISLLDDKLMEINFLVPKHNATHGFESNVCKLFAKI
jgi:hypothetical protein